ncbi:MAG TPA: hypothetical protein VGM44_00145, partial [Polyangiaceae bacterium]
CATCCGDGDCDDLIACTTDTCSGGACSNTPDNATCGSGLTCDPANGGCIQCTSDKDCDDGSSCTEDSCDLSTHKCAHKSMCGSDAPLCCGSVCGACCADIDCRAATGPITTAAAPIGKSCPQPFCDLSKHACSSRIVSCPQLGTCCATGCCSGIQPE